MDILVGTAESGAHLRKAPRPFPQHFRTGQIHACSDRRSQEFEVTAASVHDSQVFDELLDQGKDENGAKRAVYADSAYRSKEQEARLEAAGIESQVCEKGSRGHSLTEEQKAANHQKSKTRSRIEHVFGAQAQMGGWGGGHWVRTIGIGRARVKIALMNLAYNMRRYVLLYKRAIQMPNGFDGRGASAAA